MDDINISELDAAEVLARLYNEARPLGMGVFQDMARAGKPMTRDEAEELLVASRAGWGGKRASFDYVFGRPLKVDFVVDNGRFVALRGARLYDRDQGSGRCQRIVDAIRGTVK